MKDAGRTGKKLRELESKGLAKFQQKDDSGDGALPVLRLAKCVDDLSDVIRDSKSG